MFQHAGIVHLIVNSLAFIGMFRVLEKFVNRWYISVSAVLIAFMMSFLSMYDIPTVGASAMVYVMIGIYISVTQLYDNIKIVNRKKYILFLLCVAVSLIVSYFKPQSNFFLHAFSLLMGISCGVAFSIYEK
jgi:membrane associated rhomboid family serine protease